MIHRVNKENAEGLPYSFGGLSKQECIEKLKMLAAKGFRFPEDVIEEIEKEDENER
jgi:hypothetical protein